MRSRCIRIAGPNRVGASPTVPRSVARTRRVEDDNGSLRRRLSEVLGEQVWADTGFGSVAEAAELRAEVERLRQQLRDLGGELEERVGDLNAAQAAKRELMNQINSSWPTTSRGSR